MGLLALSCINKIEWNIESPDTTHKRRISTNLESRLQYHSGLYFKSWLIETIIQVAQISLENR